MTDKKAKKAVNQFLVAWQAQEWVKMLKSTQLTWRSIHKDPMGWLKSWFGLRTLKSFKIIGTEAVGDACIDVFVNLDYERQSKRIQARVIGERAAYEASVKGKWGVNPVSCLKEKGIE